MTADVIACQPLEIGEQPSHSRLQIAAAPPALSVPILESDGCRLSTLIADVTAVNHSRSVNNGLTRAHRLVICKKTSVRPGQSPSYVQHLVPPKIKCPTLNFTLCLSFSLFKMCPTISLKVSVFKSQILAL